MTKFPWLSSPPVMALVAAVPDIRFVGGCVRDTMLGLPLKDLDACTPLTPEVIIKRLEKASIRAIPTGIAHGTVTALVKEVPIEITTLRKDVACDGRHAEVEYTSEYEEDAARRDFTVNAMSITPQGKLYDYFGGLADIDEKQLRFIGDAGARLQEDGLRLLRYFRFQAQLGFAGDEETNAICRSHVAVLNHLSGERIQQEMMKLLGSPGLTHELLTTMRKCGVFQHLLGIDMVINIRGLFNLEQKFGILPDARVRLTALLRRMPEPEIRVAEIAERWKFSNDLRSNIERLLIATPKLIGISHEKEAKKHLRAMGKYLFEHALILAETEHANSAFAEWLELAETWEIPAFPVTGKDLLDKGMTPGSELGKMLKMLETEWEENNYTPTKESLLAKRG